MIKMVEYDWEGRTKKARDLMQKNDIDCLYLCAGRNQKYFSGFSHWGGWPVRLNAYILPLEGEPVRVVTPMDPVIMQTRGPRNALGRKYYLYTDGDEVMARKQLKQALKDLKIEDGVIGVEDEIRYMDFLLLQKVIPEATIKNVAKTILDPIRMIKDDLEIMNIRKSAKLSDRFLETAAEIIEIGKTTGDVGLEMAKLIIEEGSTGRARPIGWFDQSHKIQKGDVFDFEPVPRVDGYGAEVARTFFVGEAERAQRITWKACMDAFNTVEPLVRPGVTMHELDMANRKAMQKGLKEIIPNFKQFWKVGHGMGLAGDHERPHVQENNMIKAVPGMVIVIDPGIIGRKPEFTQGIGVSTHIIGTVLVTEDGCERLDKFTDDITII